MRMREQIRSRSKVWSGVPNILVALLLVVASTPGAGLAQETGGAAPVSPAGAEAVAAPAVEKFAIRAFDIKGISVLPADEVRDRVVRHVGEQRDFGDLQRAIDDIEALYRGKGYGAVQVTLPEQDITQGTIVVQIVETPVGRVDVRGTRQYSPASIRKALPALKEGSTPNAGAISRNIQLANENPGRQLEVVLAVGERENTVDARVEVREDQVRRFSVTADNSGTRPTGQSRLGVSYVDANLFDHDHVGTLAYTTSPDAPSGVDTNVVSMGYRVPFPAQDGSLALMYGYSNVSTPAAQATGVAINGKGSVAALRWAVYRPRRGEYSSQLAVGIDWKALRSTCKDSNGNTVVGTAGCLDYTTAPLSITYNGRRDGVGSQYDYSVGVYRNIPTGDRYAFSIDGMTESDRYSLAAANRKSRDDFSLLKIGGSVSTLLGAWMARLALNGQYAFDSALVGSEQFGLTGAQAVRGFLDRVVIADSGVVINVEAYSPDFANLIGLTGHALRGVVFADYGQGRDHGTSGLADKTLASWGLGLRYQMGRNLSVRLDAASILKVDPQDAHRGSDPRGGFLDKNDQGDWRAHAALAVSF